ncbi:MAG: glycosyltransferase family 2 protein [Bacteroidetes bacterium]|nr:glycosyltransferase family 2 protein [Bacteroidota bacterium]MBS1539697.1 glycosyltransferase family 2 protein [Bacteroidota bacterium]
MTKTAIVILNYNGKKFLEQFLPAITSYSHEASVFVVDNHSTDDSVEFVQRTYPEIEVIVLKENLGFCGGYNAALKQIQATYYGLINSDIEVTEGWLQPIVELLDHNPAIAAVQPKILSFKTRNKFEYAGAAGGMIDTLGFPFCRGRLFNDLEEDHGQYNDEVPIFWASGACLFVRSDRFHELGGLDEDFFAHMEEIDLCWKFHRAGHLVFYQGKSTVYHVGGGTLSASNPKKTYLNFRNGLSLLWKHERFSRLVWKFPLRIFLDWMAAFHFLYTGSAVHGKAVLIAHLSFVRRVRHEFRKRLDTARALRNFKTPNIYPGLIVMDYFVLRKRRYGELKIPDRTTLP